MLALFSLAALVAFCVMGAVVGWKVRRLARSGGGEPERHISRCLLGICAIGYPIMMTGQALPFHAAHVAAVFLGVSAVNYGLLSGFRFTRCVFRPEVAWLGPALAGVGALLVVQTVGMTWQVAQATPGVQPGSFWTLSSSLVSAVGFGWTALEALAYGSRLRLRVPLGLADPLVVNRVFLWALVGTSSVLINTVNVAGILRGINVLQDPVTMLATGVLGSLNSVALWLAFLPPEAYARWIRRGAPGAPGAPAA
jgi:hypothetical protein